MRGAGTGMTSDSGAAAGKGQYLDLSGCGIGNIVLCAAGWKARCDATGHPPLVYTDQPADLAGLADGAFVVLPSRPVNLSPVDKSDFCNVQSLRVLGPVMRMIVKPMDPGAAWDALGLPPEWLSARDTVGIAGMSIRFGDPVHDGEVTHGNDTSMAVMYEHMAVYPRVVVCTNDAGRLAPLPPNAVLAERTDPTVRNAATHWAQWHALSMCNVVYHNTGGDGAKASTFGPTAAVRGCAVIVGVDNDGCVRPFIPGRMYQWH